MKKAIIVSIIAVSVCVVLASGSYVYAATAIEGFNDTLLALLDGLKAYFDAVIEVFGMVL